MTLLYKLNDTETENYDLILKKKKKQPKQLTEWKK